MKTPTQIDQPVALHRLVRHSSWLPIETAPINGEVCIMIAAIHDGEIQEIDFDAIYEQEQESWEIPQMYWMWKSAYGRVEEPTHWAFLPILPNTQVSRGEVTATPPTLKS